MKCKRLATLLNNKLLEKYLAWVVFFIQMDPFKRLAHKNLFKDHPNIHIYNMQLLNNTASLLLIITFKCVLKKALLKND